MGALLVVFLLVLTGWAAYVQRASAAAQALTAHADGPLYVAILTKPGMTAAYNPASRKAVLTTLRRKKLPEDPLENAQDLFRLTGISTPQVRYYIPQNTEHDAYWDTFKDTLETWRYNPLRALQAGWAYARAYYEKRTNINPAEFLLYALDLSRLEITDFTVRHAGTDTKKRRSTPAQGAAPDAILPPTEDRAPLAKADGPLKVEILNASGKKGAALELTKYLRDKSQKGLLHVDVLDYDNFPGGRKPQTYIIDFTGRLAQLKQLSTAIGVKNEIVSERQDTAISDARIIIGEDFKQPL